MILFRGCKEMGLWTSEGLVGWSASVREGVFLGLRSGRLVIYLPKLLLSMCLLKIYYTERYNTNCFISQLLNYLSMVYHVFLSKWASFSIWSGVRSHPKRIRCWEIEEPIFLSSSYGYSGKSSPSSSCCPP